METYTISVVTYVLLSSEESMLDLNPDTYCSAAAAASNLKQAQT